ncbi:transmembrane 220 family protein [Fulvivirga sedimenti]|uniref:Transmembrane 220 family protein n=1 Tax=Fulvivirga sedimenti TaxID=2879465 RepID=A0A9X1HWK1_9BACT|nr:transmembrane 220 family protein [Fulvivirga sedimenti]MCA6079161.1 transmembrane 220 family protein [Fulvivirga sedimenti]
MKAIKIILALLFLLFAVVQYNDPDPWLWIAIYGITAGLFIANIWGWYNKTVLLVFLVLGVLYSLTYLGGVIDYIGMGQPAAIVETMKAEKPYIEETREFFGMWIVIAAIWFLFKKGRN